jgi:DNA-binding GntR family transcriptional regulator
VTRLNPVDIAERVSTRIMLEPVVCWMAANRMTPADFADLELHLKAISDAIQANLPFETAQADLAFHRRIWTLSDCRFWYQVLDQATLPLFAFISLLRYRRQQPLAEVVLPHEEILNALRSPDKTILERIIREHLMKSYRDFIEPGLELPGLF